MFETKGVMRTGFRRNVPSVVFLAPNQCLVVANMLVAKVNGDGSEGSELFLLTEGVWKSEATLHPCVSKGVRSHPRPRARSYSGENGRSKRDVTPVSDVCSTDPIPYVARLPRHTIERVHVAFRGEPSWFVCVVLHPYVCNDTIRREGWS